MVVRPLERASGARMQMSALQQPRGDLALARRLLMDARFLAAAGLA